MGYVSGALHVPKTTKRAALYVRVSTDQQSVDNQLQELGQIAERRGWTVVETYRDAGISGAKGATSARAWTRCSRMLAGASSTW